MTNSIPSRLMITDTYHPAAQAIVKAGLVVIARIDPSAPILEIAAALQRGGVCCLEIPMTNPDAAGVIRQVRDRFGDTVTVGAGTVLDAKAASEVIAAGATFVVSPHYEPDVLRICKDQRVAAIPGAFSPAEIYRAWHDGADIVKVFSIRSLGPKYLSDLAGPYPDIRLMPTGGITYRDAGAFIQAGACAVTVGRDLIGNGPWTDATLASIEARAREASLTIQQAKGVNRS